MDYLFKKIKGLRSPKLESPKYQRSRRVRETNSSRASTSDSYYTAAPNFIDKVQFLEQVKLTITLGADKANHDSNARQVIGPVSVSRLVIYRNRNRGAQQQNVLQRSATNLQSAENVLQEIHVILGRPIFINRTCDVEANFSESEFVLDCLHWHNVFREKHGVPPLSLSNQLCSMAQFWANHLAHTNTFSHRNVRDIGENLFCKWSYIPDFDITGEQVCKYWYEEIKVYNFYQDPSLLHVKAGHFTQMVWRSSREFGVGKARSRCGKVLVIANYKPSGNVIGEFHDNVFPALDDVEIPPDIG